MMDGASASLARDRSRRTPRLAWRISSGAFTESERAIAEEMPISFAYEGAAYAVMMASPVDLEDFAIGFSLTEGLVASAEEIEAVEIKPHEDGIVLRIAIAGPRADAFWERRRYLAGPSGCGICGLESLAQAMRAVPRVRTSLSLAPEAVGEMVCDMARRQALNRETGAVHAAAFWRPGDGISLLREDVGRHNALDKLAGALARVGLDGGDGAVLLTSRVSVEMVQKAAVIGTSVLVAMSAPTSLAIRIAAEAGMTLAAVARADGFEIFTHPHRFLATQEAGTGRAPHLLMA